MSTNLNKDDLLEVCWALTNDVYNLQEYFVWRDNISEYEANIINERISKLQRLARHFGDLVDSIPHHSTTCRTHSKTFHKHTIS